MSDFSDARALRLERLECRTLLAGGVFDFAFSEGNIEFNLLPNNPPGDSSRPDEVGRNNPQPTRSETPSARKEPPRQNQPAQNVPGPAANEIFAVAPLLAANPSSPPSFPPTPQTQAVTREPSAVDAAIALLTSETSTEANAESDLAQLTNEVSTIDPATRSRIIATETTTTQQENAVVPMVIDNPSASDDGFIELAPLESFQPFFSNDRGNERWELDRHTIPLLRQIARHADVDRTALVDQMMKDWFTGPGGLIALDQVDLPAITLPLEADMIDVGLESTVALHRSLDLVASSVNPALSGRVLDAIMASLEHVAASETQPVIEPSQLRIPTATYPAVAVVATAIALSACRKHKHPQLNLQFTTGK